MDNSKPEAQQQQQQPFSETEITSDSTSSSHQQPDISPGVFPAPLQTSASSTRSPSQTGSPPRRKPEAETLPVESSGVTSSGHERMPSVNSLPPKEGHFGVVSSSGQLVCEFRPTPSGGLPNPQPQQSAEQSITRATFAATNSELKTPGAPISPPPPAPNSPSPPSLGPTVSTLELAVDYNSYPEVYIPESQQQDQNQGPNHPPRTGTTSPPIQRKSLPIEYEPSLASSPPPPPHQPAPAYSTPADYQRIGYTGTLDMSTAVATVTPLHMLGDQPDTVDCPFCMRRVETSVKKKASSRTQ